MRIIALIDGEHHPGVVRDALDHLAAEQDLCAVLFVGGEEKVSAEVLADPDPYYGRHVVAAARDPVRALQELATAQHLDAVVDLSDEPVLDPAARLRLASVALHLGLDYWGPGFELAAPRFEPVPFAGPILAVTGTGKRTGKTAVAGHLAILLRDRGHQPVVVSMGRGGPGEPQLVRAAGRPGVEDLLAIARAGRHAASDYLEDAVLARVSCVGTRRCGGGLGGETFDSNVLDGVRLALSLEPGALLLEGSGATVPPVEVHRTICVTGADRARREALDHLGPYRLLRSQLVVVTQADHLHRAELRELQRDLYEWSAPAPVVGCVLDPEPAEPVPAGSRVAFFTTAPPGREADLRDRLDAHGVDPIVFSPNLAHRAALEEDLERAARDECDVYLTEIKAAAIDTVAEHAARRGARVVFVRNRPVPLPGEPDLDGELIRLLEEARREAAEGEPAREPGARVVAP